MVELGELEKRHADFAKRNTRVVVISNDNQADARATQARFPHLVVVADTDQKMAKTLKMIHPGMSPEGTDTNSPTTILLDGGGKVRWLFRADRFLTRLPPEELLTEIDKK